MQGQAVGPPSCAHVSLAKGKGWHPLFKFDALLVRPGLGDDRVI